jgi:hypothetical protein
MLRFAESTVQEETVRWPRSTATGTLQRETRVWCLLFEIIYHSRRDVKGVGSECSARVVVL